MTSWKVLAALLCVLQLVPSVRCVIACSGTGFYTGNNAAPMVIPTAQGNYSTAISCILKGNLFTSNQQFAVQFPCRSYVDFGLTAYDNSFLDVISTQIGCSTTINACECFTCTIAEKTTASQCGLLGSPNFGSWFGNIPQCVAIASSKKNPQFDYLYADGSNFASGTTCGLQFGYQGSADTQLDLWITVAPIDGYCENGGTTVNLHPNSQPPCNNTGCLITDLVKCNCPTKCNGFWSGADCSVPQCTIVAPSSCGACVFGQCAFNSSTTCFQCNCNAGWSGPCCDTCDSLCSNHGTCSTNTNGTCICNEQNGFGWIGTNCNVPSCSLDVCNPTHAICNTTDDSPLLPTCTCDPLWSSNSNCYDPELYLLWVMNQVRSHVINGDMLAAATDLNAYLNISDFSSISSDSCNTNTNYGLWNPSVQLPNGWSSYSADAYCKLMFLMESVNHNYDVMDICHNNIQWNSGFSWQTQMQQISTSASQLSVDNSNLISLYNSYQLNNAQNYNLNSQIATLQQQAAIINTTLTFYTQSASTSAAYVQSLTSECLEIYDNLVASGLADSLQTQLDQAQADFNNKKTTDSFINLLKTVGSVVAIPIAIASGSYGSAAGDLVKSISNGYNLVQDQMASLSDCITDPSSVPSDLQGLCPSYNNLNQEWNYVQALQADADQAQILVESLSLSLQGGQPPSADQLGILNSIQLAQGDLNSFLTVFIQPYLSNTDPSFQSYIYSITSMSNYMGLAITAWQSWSQYAMQAQQQQSNLISVQAQINDLQIQRSSLQTTADYYRNALLLQSAYLNDMEAAIKYYREFLKEMNYWSNNGAICATLPLTETFTDVFSELELQMALPSSNDIISLANEICDNWNNDYVSHVPGGKTVDNYAYQCCMMQITFDEANYPNEFQSLRANNAIELEILPPQIPVDFGTVFTSFGVYFGLNNPGNHATSFTNATLLDSCSNTNSWQIGVTSASSFSVLPPNCDSSLPSASCIKWFHGTSNSPLSWIFAYNPTDTSTFPGTGGVVLATATINSPIRKWTITPLGSNAACLSQANSITFVFRLNWLYQGLGAGSPFYFPGQPDTSCNGAPYTDSACSSFDPNSTLFGGILTCPPAPTSQASPLPDTSLTNSCQCQVSDYSTVVDNSNPVVISHQYDGNNKRGLSSGDIAAIRTSVVEISVTFQGKSLPRGTTVSVDRLDGHYGMPSRHLYRPHPNLQNDLIASHSGIKLYAFDSNGTVLPNSPIKILIKILNGYQPFLYVLDEKTVAHKRTWIDVADMHHCTNTASSRNPESSDGKYDVYKFFVCDVNRQYHVYVRELDISGPSPESTVISSSNETDQGISSLSGDSITNQSIPTMDSFISCASLTVTTQFSLVFSICCTVFLLI